jgi:hypothetical protein
MLWGEIWRSLWGIVRIIPSRFKLEVSFALWKDEGSNRSFVAVLRFANDQHHRHPTAVP